MRPVSTPLDVYGGDDREIRIRLWSKIGDTRVPLDESGSQFDLIITGPGGKRVSILNSNLELRMTPEEAPLIHRLPPVETNRIRRVPGATCPLTRTGQHSRSTDLPDRPRALAPPSMSSKTTRL